MKAIDYFPKCSGVFNISKVVEITGHWKIQIAARPNSTGQNAGKLTNM
jgi:hypothetical protein